MAAPIGAEIRALRLARGLSMVEAARRAGTSRVTLHRWETGENLPPPEALARLLQGIEAEPGERARLLTSAAPRAAHPSLAATPLGAPVHPGHAIKALRARRGLTQSALAQAAGVGQGLVAMWESGARSPKGEALSRALEALGATHTEAGWLDEEARDRYEPLRSPFDVSERLRSAAPVWSRPSRTVELMALEREVWELAIRDPRWQVPLARVSSWRAWSHSFDFEHDAALSAATSARRIAQETGAWDAIVWGEMATVYVRSRRNADPTRIVQMGKRYLSRVRDPEARGNALIELAGVMWSFDPKSARHALRLAYNLLTENSLLSEEGGDLNCVCGWHAVPYNEACLSAQNGDPDGAFEAIRHLPKSTEIQKTNLMLASVNAHYFAGDRAPATLVREVDRYRRSATSGFRKQLRKFEGWLGLEPIP